MFPFTRSARRKKLLAEPFPDAWLKILHGNVFLYRLLSESEQVKLRDALRIFIAEKYWEGCRGQEITDEVKVTIAAHACVLTLGFEDFYFDDVQTVLVYPGGFLVDDLGGDDAEAERVRHLVGMASAGGPILLSWWEVCWDGRRFGTSNVVLHEFAHALGHRFDPREAVPMPGDAQQLKRWRSVIDKEFRRLREDADYGRETLIDTYGAQSVTEFFAVATECFFLQPGELKLQHPKLYEALAGCFNQDPAQRRLPTDAERAEMEHNEDAYEEHIVAECTTAIRLRPEYVNAYLARAAALRALGRDEEALADFTVALRHEPENAELYCDRAGTLRLLGRLPEALADYDRAHALAEDFARPLYERGLTHMETEDFDKALADFNAALALDPQDDAIYRARAHVHFARDDQDRALEDFTEAIRLWPRSAVNLFERAHIFIELGKIDEALRDCDRAIALDPQLPEAYMHRAEAYLRKGDHARALADASEAIRLAADYADAYDVRADAYEALGENEKALADRSRAEELAGDGDD